MQYTVQPGDTWNSVATTYTLGGVAYGPALANYNGAPGAAGGETLYPDVNTITIPDNWLTTNVQSPSTLPTAGAAGSGIGAGISALFKSPSGLVLLAGAAYLLFKGGIGGTGIAHADEDEDEDETEDAE